jgi:chromosome segregation ATPase
MSKRGFLFGDEQADAKRANNGPDPATTETLGGIVCRLKGLEKKMDVSVENHIAMQGLLQDVARRSDKTNFRVRTIELTQIPHLLSAIATVTSKLDTAVSKMDLLSSKVDTLTEKVDSLTSKFEELEQKLVIVDAEDVKEDEETN